MVAILGQTDRSAMGGSYQQEVDLLSLFKDVASDYLQMVTAMQMNGLAELITIKHYWQEWSDPRLIIAVLHNDDLNRGHLGDTRHAGRPEVHRVPAPARRRLRRLRGVARPERGIGRQTRPGRPLLGAGADRRPAHPPRRPHRPRYAPIPPHITFAQAKNSAEALLKGDPNRLGIIKEGVKTKVQEFLQHRDKDN